MTKLLLGIAEYWVSYVFSSNYVSNGKCPKGNCPEWQLSGMASESNGKCLEWQLYRMATVPNGNCLHGKCLEWQVSEGQVAASPKNLLL